MHFHFAFNKADYNFIRNQFTFFVGFFHFDSKVGSGFNFAAKQRTGRNVVEIEFLRQQAALCSFAGTRRS